MPLAVTPSTFSSTIDLGLPISPIAEATAGTEDICDDLASAFQACQILQQYLTTALADIATLKLRLAAAGIP